MLRSEMSTSINPDPTPGAWPAETGRPAALLRVMPVPPDHHPRPTPMQTQPAWMRHVGVFMFWTVLLHLSFAYDVFAVFGSPRSLFIGADSNLPLNRLALDERHDIGLLHPMSTQIDDPTAPKTRRLDYYSQVGLPGLVLNAVATWTGVNRLRLAFA